MGLRRILRNLDWWLIFAVLILMGCGLGLIDSATHSFAVSTGKSWHFNRQSTFMLIAIFLAICTLRAFLFFSSSISSVKSFNSPS